MARRHVKGLVSEDVPVKHLRSEEAGRAQLPTGEWVCRAAMLASGLEPRQATLRASRHGWRAPCGSQRQSRDNSLGDCAHQRWLCSPASCGDYVSWLAASNDALTTGYG